MTEHIPPNQSKTFKGQISKQVSEDSIQLGIELFKTKKGFNIERLYEPYYRQDMTDSILIWKTKKIK